MCETDRYTEREREEGRNIKIVYLEQGSLIIVYWNETEKEPTQRVFLSSHSVSIFHSLFPPLHQRWFISPS